MIKKYSTWIIFMFCLIFTGCGNGSMGENSSLDTETVKDSDSGSVSGQKAATQADAGEGSGSGTEKAGAGAADAKVLAVYFSRVRNTDFPENVDAVASASLLVKDGEIKGNAQVLAEWAADEAGGDIFEIVTEKTYPADYSETTDVAKQEQNEDARPKLKAGALDFLQYDTFYLVFPNWWGDLPQALYSFFDEYDFSGKRLNVFVTHGGSSFSSTIQTMQELEPDAEVVEGLSVRDSAVPDAESEVREWVKNAN